MSEAKVKQTLRQRARKIKSDVYALYFAYRDPRVPWYAKLFAALVVGYAFSPIDLIPDFVPLLGYLDDVIIIPLGITLAIKMIPEEAMNEAREKANELHGKPKNWFAAIIIIAVWILLAFAAAWFVYHKIFL